MNCFRSSLLSRSSSLSSRFRSVPSSQVKAFRLKRLHSTKSVDDETTSRRSLSMRFSLSPSSPSLLHRFRSLSTYPTPLTRRQSSSSSPLTLFRTTSVLPPIVEEQQQQTNDEPVTPPMSCTIVDARRPAGNSCNVEELAAYLDNFLYLPKSLSGAAELMYT